MPLTTQGIDLPFSIYVGFRFFSTVFLARNASDALSDWAY